MENQLDRTGCARGAVKTAGLVSRRGSGSGRWLAALLFSLPLSGGAPAAATGTPEEVVTEPAVEAPEAAHGRIDLVHPPGRRFDIGGIDLHLYCVGEGSPTVVLDAGLGGFSLEWAPVQLPLSTELRICSYDRAGYGWSDAVRGRRTTVAIVTELRQLLDVAGERGPFVLVGHSFGGYTVQGFAQRFPEDTAGLVLVDASHPAQHDRLPRRLADEGQKQPTRGRRLQTATPTLPDGFPTEYAEVAYHLMYARKAVGAQRKELADFDASGRQLQSGGPLPPVPLIVLTRGLRVWPRDDFGDEMERVWTELQNDLTRVAGPSAHWYALQSGHYIHLDEPAIVIEAVKAVVLAARNATTPNPRPAAATTEAAVEATADPGSAGAPSVTATPGQP
jgi:pimeloyl-ACP methyl ester carboxylesterase